MVDASSEHRHWRPTGTKLGTRGAGPPWSRPQFTPVTAGALSEVLLFTHKASRFGRRSTHFPGWRRQWNSPFSQARWHRCQVTADLSSRPPLPPTAAVVSSRTWVQEDFTQDHFSCQALPQEPAYQCGTVLPGHLSRPVAHCSDKGMSSRSDRSASPRATQIIPPAMTSVPRGEQISIPPGPQATGQAGAGPTGPALTQSSHLKRNPARTPLMK